METNIKENQKALRKLDLKERILRLSVLTGAFGSFTQAELNRSLLSSDNTWKSAEKTADMVNFFFPFHDAQPKDFLYEASELTNKSIEHWEEFKKYIPAAIINGISEDALTAFCKRAENTAECWMLKVTAGLHYPYFLNALFQYVNGEIDKNTLREQLTEFDCLLDAKPKRIPANLRMFRRCIIRMESILKEIQEKQLKRRGIDVSNIGHIVTDLTEFDNVYKRAYPELSSFNPSVKCIIVNKADISENLCKVYLKEKKYSDHIPILVSDLEEALSKIGFECGELYFQPFITGNAVYHSERTKVGEICRNYLLLECRIDFEQVKSFFGDLELFINEENLNIDISGVKNEVLKIQGLTPSNKLDEKLPEMLKLMTEQFNKIFTN